MQTIAAENITLLRRHRGAKTSKPNFSVVTPVFHTCGICVDRVSVVAVHTLDITMEANPFFEYRETM
jgi:hypothetical protein